MSEKERKVLTLADLGISQEAPAAVVPSGGEGFAAGSFIAQWQGSVMFQFWTLQDYLLFNQDAEEDDEPLAPKPDIRRQIVAKDDRVWYIHFHYDYDVAMAAYEMLEPEGVNDEGQHYNPKSRYVITAPTSTVLNRSQEGLQAIVDGFGDDFVFDTNMGTLRSGSKRYGAFERHHYALLFLPCIIAALAEATGKSDIGFDITELTEEGAADNFTPDLFKEFFGDPEGTYTGCTAVTRRDRLWANLGEDNVRMQAVMDAKTAKGKRSSIATSSKVLSGLLSVVQRPWGRPLWARVTTVPNPGQVLEGEYEKAKAQTSSIYCITEFFGGEADARAAAEAELAEKGQVAGSAGAVTSAGEAFPMPEKWKENTPEDVIKHINDNQMPDFTGTPPAQIAAKAKWYEDVMYMTAEELVACEEAME